MIHIPEKCTGCLTCQLVCALSHHGECNPSLACIDLRTDALIREADFTADCDECARCARYCPYGALEKGN